MMEHERNETNTLLTGISFQKHFYFGNMGNDHNCSKSVRRCEYETVNFSPYGYEVHLLPNYVEFAEGARPAMTIVLTFLAVASRFGLAC